MTVPLNVTSAPLALFWMSLCRPWSSGESRPPQASSTSRPAATARCFTRQALPSGRPCLRRAPCRESRPRRRPTAYSARHLELDTASVEHSPDHGLVAGRAARGVEVDDVHPPRPGGGKSLDDLQRVLRIHRRFVVVTLRESYAAPAEYVYRR